MAFLVSWHICSAAGLGTMPTNCPKSPAFLKARQKIRELLTEDRL